MFVRLIALVLAASITDARSSVTIWNVTVVDPAAGASFPTMLVEIEDDRISTVRPAEGRPPSTDGTLVDGTGKFLMPGLWDSHVHLTKLGASALPLFVAHGITSVRDMGSDLSEMLRWRSQIDQSDRIGPRIKTAGQILESKANFDRMLDEGTVEPVNRIRKPLAGPDDARRYVGELVHAGADFIKVRTVPGRETFLALADACREHRVKLTGHPVAPPESLAEAGMASVEHALSLSPHPSTQGRARIHGVVKAAGLYVGTTVSNYGGSVLLSYNEAAAKLKTDPRMRFVGAYLRSDWREQVEEKASREAREALTEFRRLIPSLNNELRELHEAGVPLLARDAAVLFAFPGSSLHAELRALVEDVGLSPVEALRSATTNPARFFGLQDELGSIREGYLADLVLLDGDPLKDVRNTQRIVGVAIRGQWFDEAELEGLTEAAASLARSSEE